MILAGASAELTPQSTHTWPSILQVILSCIAALWLFGQSALLFALWVAALLIPETAFAEASMLLTLGLVSFVFAVLVVPSAVTAFYLVRGRALPAWFAPAPSLHHQIINRSLLILPVILALGILTGTSSAMAGFLLPALGIFSISLPVLWLVSYGSWQLPGGSPQRKWGLLAFGLVFSPLLIILLEILVILIGLFGFAIWASTNPEVMGILMELGQSISTAGTNLDETLETLLPYLTRPGVILGTLITISVIVPLIEELFKTLGVWLLVGRKLTPGEGYVAGLLSGTGFTMVEGLFNLNSATTGQEWLILSIGRIGSSLLHIFTGGLIGWGLACAWRAGKPVKYISALTISLFVHGLWNALAVAAAFLPMILYPEKTLSGAETLLYYIPVILLGLLMLGAFIAFTRHLRKKSTSKLNFTGPDLAG